MLSTPRVRKGAAQLHWFVEDGRVSYQVRGRSQVGLGAPAVALALLADGQRTMADILDEAEAHGLRLGDPAQLILLFRQLDFAGAVEMDWHLESLGPLGHDCVGCGQSCQGHLITLSQGERTRIQGLIDELRQLEPALGALEPTTFNPESGATALNTESGQCVFLDGDRRCLIHKHFGAETKPLACRLFPWRIINTEDGFRVGVTSRCMNAHKSYAPEAPVTPGQALATLGLRRPPGDVVGLDPSNVRSLAYTPAFQGNAEQEGYYLSLLSQPDLTLASLIASSTGIPRTVERPPESYLADVSSRLTAFPDRYQPNRLNRPGNVFGDESVAFLGRLERLVGPPEWSEPPSAVWKYAAHSLTQFVFLRETVHFPSVEVAVHAALIGVLGAFWCARQEASAGVELTDLFAQHLGLWLRWTHVAGASQFLFASANDYNAYLATLIHGKDA